MNEYCEKNENCASLGVGTPSRRTYTGRVGRWVGGQTEGRRKGRWVGGKVGWYTER